MSIVKPYQKQFDEQHDHKKQYIEEEMREEVISGGKDKGEQATLGGKVSVDGVIKRLHKAIYHEEQHEGSMGKRSLRSDQGKRVEV